MVCFGYVIVNTLKKGGGVDDDDDDNLLLIKVIHCDRKKCRFIDIRTIMVATK
jgi:hypothetical protein